MEVGTIKPVQIEAELRTSYLDYAMSVIVARALPDVRDGLKPVQRRILYALEQLGMRPNTPYRKCARLVGEVLGKFHPHGEAPVYEALVRMAQDFSLRYPLVDGQGNFGSIDDDPPAAMRYTEARLAAIAAEMLADIDKETVDFTPNFDDSLTEPTVLPTVLPNLLLNGSSGIAVGMATNIPPHNLREICDAIIFLINNPEATPEELLSIVPGPDFPTAGIIIGKQGIRDAYASGKGRIVLRGKVEVDEPSRGRRQLLITQLPYLTNKAALVERIAFLSRERRLEGIGEVRDESDRHGIRVVLELKREAQPEKVINNLYKYTPLQTAFNVNMLALVAGEPKEQTLRGALEHHISFRQEVIARRSRYELKLAQQRAHILEGLRIALQHLDEVIRTIRRSENAEVARQQLMSQFTLSQEQAQAILDMPLRRLAALERQKIEDEYAEVVKNIAYLEDLLANPRKVLFLVQEELRTLKNKYGDARRTQISEEEEVGKAEEDYVHHELVAVVLGQRYIRRLPLDSFRRQRRGGRGVAGMGSDEGRFLLVADTHQRLLFLSDAGKVYSQKVYQLPAELSRTSKGTPLLNVFDRLTPGETFTAIAIAQDLAAPAFLLMATRRGEIKKTPLSEFASVRSQGVIALDLGKDDSVVSALVAMDGDEVVLVSQQGKGLRFQVKPLRAASRHSGGVRAMSLTPGDEVVGMGLSSAADYLLVVTAQGFGKLVALSRFPRHRRGGMGITALATSAKTGRVVAVASVQPADEVLLLSVQGNVTRTQAQEIPVQGRSSRGAQLMNLEPGDEVLGCTVFSPNGKESAD